MIFCLLLFTASGIYAKQKTFTREYTYQASEMDSKVSSRTNATAEMRNILLREVGTYIRSEQQTSVKGNTQDYAEKIEAITAGIVEMKVLEEKWDFGTYYIKAEMTVDPDDVNKRIAEVLNDKQLTKELEDSRKRTREAETEIAKLKREMEAQQRQFAKEKDATKKTLAKERDRDLQVSYNKQIDWLSAEKYYDKALVAHNNGLYELAVEYYQKCTDISPHYSTYFNMGCSYDGQNNYTQAISCYQKAILMNPNYVEAYCNMGTAYYRLGNVNKQLECYKKAARLGDIGCQNWLKGNGYSW
ncbi:hypothetical protein AGMMS49982_16330 [Bacteroidia bacterium]|nr:hypothetical protein AGMMS49982_16330 [Bacteroidia bacterium]